MFALLTKRLCGFALAALLIATPAPTAMAQSTALQANPETPAAFILNVGRTGGWRFTVNGVIQITHLGLFDHHADGFLQSYPIGIWDSAGVLLTSATLPAGIASDYVDGFRYVDVAAGPVLLPGQTYTIGYFAATLAPDDRMINDLGFHSAHPLINQFSPAVSSNGAFAELTFPTVSFTETWVGPSFQFIEVPGPAAWIVLAGALCMNPRRRSLS